MRKILIGFITITLLSLFSCDKEGNDTNITFKIQYGEGVTDIDGNIYGSVRIGEQEWMSENLRTSKFADGISIINVVENSSWGNLTTEAWCYYDNDSQYNSLYGKLYNWHALETEKLCPTGWHVPNDAEWTLLLDYLASYGFRGTEEQVLKSTSGWDDYNGQSGNGNDALGWNGLPASLRGDSGGFGVGNSGQWWSSSEYNTDRAWNLSFTNANESVFMGHTYKEVGNSVRCIKD